MTTSVWISARVLLASSLLLSPLARAERPDGQADRAARAACIREATPLFSSSMSDRAEYVARLCRRPTPSTVQCVRDVKPSLVVMSDWPETLEALCSRPTSNTAGCFLGVRKALSIRSDWLKVAVALCQDARPDTLGCFYEAWKQRSFDSRATIKECGGG